MRYINLFRFFLLVTFFSVLSCQNDSDPEPANENEGPVLTIDASEYVVPSATESWLFTVNREGAVLETKQLLDGDVLDFTTDPLSDSITLVQVNRYSEDMTSIIIFGGIKTGSTLKFAFADKSVPPIPEFTGSASIKITNYPSIDNNPLVIASGEVYNKEEPNAGVVNGSCPIYGDKSSIVLSGYRDDGIRVYKKFTDVTAGQSIEEDFATFTPYPNFIEVPNDKDVTYLLAGYNEDWERRGTAFSSNEWYPSSPTPAIMGYLPGYKGYYTSVQSILPASNYVAVSFSKRGEVPTKAEMELPSFNYSIMSSSVKDPQFSIDKNYTFLQASWSYGTIGSKMVGCTSFTPKNFRLKLTNLPDEILAKDPDIKLDKLVLGSCYFAEYLDGFTYEQALNDIMTFNSHPITFKYRTYEFRP